jgi:hypothetical protein
LGCKLYLVSVQIQPTGPGAGESLLELVQRLSSLLSAHGRSLELFRERLESAGYFEEHSIHYDIRWALRSPVKIIHVDQDFPCLTQGGIDRLLGGEGARISEIEYTLDVSNTGHDFGTALFERVITIQ